MIEQKLDELAELKSQRDVILLEKQKIIDSILTPEIKAQIAEVEAEFAGKSESVVLKIQELETEIKKDVIENGASVKGTILHAVYAKGRVTWDSKSLDVYAKAHPEIVEYRKEGEPSVSIRIAK